MWIVEISRYIDGATAVLPRYLPPFDDLVGAAVCGQPVIESMMDYGN
jgi:hypothetical protein